MADRARVSEQRLVLGRAALLTVPKAARLLPWGNVAAEQWLRRWNLVHEVEIEDEERGLRAVEVVVWGDVLDAITGHAAPEVEAMPGDLRALPRDSWG